MQRNFCPVTFEDLSERFYIACNIKDVCNNDGDVVRTFEYTERSIKVPFTPQSGPDIYIGNLHRMLVSNSNIKHDPQYLRAALAGNPFDATRFERELLRRGNEVANNLSNSSKK